MRIPLYLLALIFAAGFVQLRAETLIDTSFGENVIAIEGRENASGVLPSGVIEDSSWAKLQLNYEVEIDRLGGLFKWLHVSLSDLEHGRGQLKWKLPTPEETTQYRLSLNLGSQTKSRLRLFVARDGAPYTVHWDQALVPNTNRSNHNFDFQLPALDHPVCLILAMEQEGNYDLGTLRLEQRTNEDIERGKAAAIAAAPDNLAPSAGFALGIPSAWGVGRNYSIVDKVRFAPAETPGPHGTVPLQIDVIEEGFTYKLYSAPFSVPDPTSIYVVSFIATGEGSGQVIVYSDGQQKGSGSYEATPEGQFVEIPFRVDELAKWNVIHWSGQNDVQIDALNVSLGKQAKPFTLPGELEVALAAGFEKANVFVEGVDTPKVDYAITGKITEDVVLKTKTYNLYDQSSEAQTIKACCDTSRGSIEPVNPDASRPYGSFRIEAWVERNGEAISPVAEQVYHVVPKPIYWGKIAPESRFGHHFNLYEPHLYGLKAIGINWERFHARPGHMTTYWSAVEPEKGKWTWNDDLINRYRDAGFATMGVLVHTPPWARVERAEARYNGWLDNWWQPRDYEDFAEYVRRATSHHKDNIDAWMVWNEPWGEFWFKEWRPELGSVKQWHHGDTPLEDFKELSRIAWEAYQETGNDKPFLSVNGTLGDKGKKWMRDSLEIGTHAFGDGLSYHAYFGGGLRNVIDQNSGMMENLERRVFEPIDNVESAAAQPVWMTEGGWLLTDWGTGLHYHSVPGDKDLLEIVREICVRMPLFHIAQLEHGVEKVFTYAVDAGPSYYMPTGNGVHNWGSMATQAGELHPSATAYAAMAQRLEKPVFNRRIQLNANTAAFVFDDTDSTLMVLVGTGSLNDYLSTFTEAALPVDDFLGNPATPGIDHQILYVSLDSSEQAETLLGL